MGKASSTLAPKLRKRGPASVSHFVSVAAFYLPTASSNGRRTGREKRPYHFQLRDEGPLMFAGIWDTWRTRTETITTCAIITTPANALVGELHDRMPAILPLEVQEAWLDRRTNRADLPGMLTPYPASRMKSYPISRKLNSPEFDDAELLVQVNNEVGTTPSLF